MRRRLWWMVLIGALLGCERGLSSQLDSFLFGAWGRTLVSHPEAVTFKEIHLSSGSYAGRDVVAEGKVVQVGERGTYIVMSDDEARMLVVLTDLEGETPAGAVASKSLRVLGTIERGKKGLPILRARALSLREPPAVGADGKA